MSPFTRLALRSLPTLATLVAGAGLFVWGKFVLRQDPFEDFHHQPELDESVGIRLKGVQLWHYKGSVVDTRATCARIDVDPQRQHLILADIENGWTRSNKGEFNFSAKTASWNDSAKALSVTAGARVYSKNFDLRTNVVEFNKGEGMLLVNGAVAGRLYDGTVSAASLRYNLDTGNYAIRNPDWEGNLTLDQGDGGQKEKPTRWHISAPDSTVTSRNGQEIWPNAVANTTDGETIIKAEMVVRDTKTDVITATGNVRYFSTKLNMTCGKAVVDRKAKKAVFTEKVHCYFKAEGEQKEKVAIVEIPPFRPLVPDAIANERPAAPPTDDDKQLNAELRSDKTARKYPVTAQAAKIEYWYAKGDRHAEISGDPQARQDFPKGKWRHLWTVQAHYDGERERLRMFGASGKQQTRIKTSANDDLKCNWFEVSTKDDDEKDWQSNGLDGTLSVDDDEETSPAKPAPPEKGGAKPTSQPPPLKGQIRM